MDQPDARATAEYAESLAENATQAAHVAQAMADLAMEAARGQQRLDSSRTAPSTAPGPSYPSPFAHQLTPLQNPFISPGDIPNVPLRMLKHALVGQLQLHFTFQIQDIRRRQETLVDNVMKISRWMQQHPALPVAEYHRLAAQLAYMVYAIVDPPCLAQPFGQHTICQRQLSVLEVVMRFRDQNGMRWRFDGEPVYGPQFGAGYDSGRRRGRGAGLSDVGGRGSSDGEGSSEVIRGANGGSNTTGESSITGSSSSNMGDVNGDAVNGNGVHGNGVHVNGVNGNQVNGNPPRIRLSHRFLGQDDEFLPNGINGIHRSRRANASSVHDDESPEDRINGHRRRRRANGFLSHDEGHLPNGVNGSPSSRRAHDFWSHDHGRPAVGVGGRRARRLARLIFNREDEHLVDGFMTMHGAAGYALNGVNGHGTNGINGHVANGVDWAHANGLTNGDHGARSGDDTDNSGFLTQPPSPPRGHHGDGPTMNGVNGDHGTRVTDDEPLSYENRGRGIIAALQIHGSPLVRRFAEMRSIIDSQIEILIERELALEAEGRGIGHAVNGVDGYGVNGVNGHAVNGVNGHVVNGINGHVVNGVNGIHDHESSDGDHVVHVVNGLNGVNGHQANGINGTHDSGSSDDDHGLSNAVDNRNADMAPEADQSPQSPPPEPEEVSGDEHDGLAIGVNGDDGH